MNHPNAGLNSYLGHSILDAVIDHALLWAVIFLVLVALTAVVAGILWAKDSWNARRVRKANRARADRLNAQFRPRPKNLL